MKKQKFDNTSLSYWKNKWWRRISNWDTHPKGLAIFDHLLHIIDISEIDWNALVTIKDKWETWSSATRSRTPSRISFHKIYKILGLEFYYYLFCISRKFFCLWKLNRAISKLVATLDRNYILISIKMMSILTLKIFKE